MKNIVLLIFVFVFACYAFNHCKSMSVHAADFKSKCNFETKIIEQVRHDMISEKSVDIEGVDQVQIESVIIRSITCIEDGSIAYFISTFSGFVNGTCVRVQLWTALAVQGSEIEIFGMGALSGERCTDRSST